MSLRTFGEAEPQGARAQGGHSATGQGKRLEGGQGQGHHSCVQEVPVILRVQSSFPLRKKSILAECGA